ncbi:MAG: AraC family transcriptional regulator [Paenibacillaceae bacterium]|nr:AraC family transcriptional regulator [Paenibacillaceae bacterium]
MHRIIIVDDEELIRESVSIQLSELEGIAVASLQANGSKALEWLEGHYADICLTDVRMPLMDGLQIIEAVNARFPWMTCVVISSYDEFQYARKSMMLGAVDYVLKPIDRDLLHEAVNKACAKNNHLRQHEANRLLLQKLPFHKPLLDKWLEVILSVYSHAQPLLVVDTLAIFEEWVKGGHQLLNELSMAWVRLLAEELKKQGLQVSYNEGEDAGLGDASLSCEEARRYFRLCAVRRLEQSSLLFLEHARQLKNLRMEGPVDKVKGFIESHYAESFSLQELADYAAMSRSYMAKLFKEKTGQTIWSYCVNVRMRKARELLLTTTLKSYEIGLQVGYENSIHFSRIFKQYHGMNPMEYKEKFASSPVGWQDF